MGGGKPTLAQHMKKAIARLEELSGVVNLVIEAVDARAPRATRCDFIARVIGGCSVATVFTKADLADPAATKAWLKHFHSQGLTAVIAPGKSNKNREGFTQELLKLSAVDTPHHKGARAVVVGLPNVGKSTITNFLIGRRSARVGATPGVTRGLQLVRVSPDFMLIDTPGIVSPRVARKDQGIVLALAGCLQDNTYDHEEAVLYLLRTTLPLYADKFTNFYGMKCATTDPMEFCEAVAVRRGFLLKGGAPDIDRAQRLITHDFAAGRIAGITLESVDGQPQDKKKPDSHK
ncbi:MAG: ribosome biogenesis GTPase YlqF [bacterium]